MFRLRGIDPPERVSAPLYFAGLLGPVLLSAAIGVLAMLTALLIVEPPPPDSVALTDFGASLFLPEWDLVIYVLSIFGVMLAAAGFCVLWNRRVRSVDPAKAPGFIVASLVLQVLVAVVATILTVGLFLRARVDLAIGAPVSAGRLAMFAAIGVALLGVAVFGSIRGGDGRITGRAAHVLHRHAALDQPGLKLSLLDLLVPVAVVLVIYVVSWRNLAGRFFVEEGLLHWDYYAMNAALAFRHGMELGTQVTWMYGVGWPMVYSALFLWMPPSYGRMIQVGSIYACVYLSGIYLLLRLVVRRPVLAAFGTALVSLQFFVGLGEANLWRYPSLTVMRSAFDVWCFIALVMHWRTGRRMWAGASGVFVGLGVAFSTDTGLYLAVAAAFYWLCILWMDADKRARLVDIVGSAGAALVTLLLVLVIAGRGQVFHYQFWRGWLALLIEFGGGFGQLPLSTLPNATTVITFLIPFFVYLAVVAYAVARLMHCRARQFDIFNACLAAYGLLLMVHFIGRSGDYTPIRLSIPLVLILVSLIGRAYGHVEASIGYSRAGEGRGRMPFLLPGILAALVLVTVAVMPRSLIVEPILNYPSPLVTALRGAPAEGRCVFLDPKDICGLPRDWEDSEPVFREVTRRLESIRADAKTFAAIDESGSTYYLAADTAPWGRYPRLFVSLHTKSKLAEVTGALRKDPPDYVLTRMPLEEDSALLERFPVERFGLGPHPETPFGDVWTELRATVQELYWLDSTIAPYEIWVLREPAAFSED